MKVTLLLSFVCLAYFSNAQICSTSQSFSSQAAVNNFVTTYSGTCDTIDGNLFISGTNITDLSGLSFLTTINGYLYLNGTTNLTSLNGLQNISTIGSYLYLRNTTSLVDANLTNFNIDWVLFYYFNRK